MKDKAQPGRNATNYISDKELVCRIYIELSNSKKQQHTTTQINQFKNGQRFEHIFHQRRYAVINKP